MSGSPANASIVRENSGKLKEMMDPESVLIIKKGFLYIFAGVLYIWHFTYLLFIHFTVFIIFESTTYIFLPYRLMRDL